MPKIKMLATKPMSYKTRRLQAGDSFEVNNRQEANVWELVRKTARPDYEVVVKPLPMQHQAPKVVPEPEPDLDALRAEAEAAGVRVDRRWGEARLRAEIASAPRYAPPQPVPEIIEPYPVPPMTTTNVGSTASPVYRRFGEEC